jgi:hypothetical protein
MSSSHEPNHREVLKKQMDGPLTSPQERGRLQGRGLSLSSGESPCEGRWTVTTRHASWRNRQEHLKTFLFQESKEESVDETSRSESRA